MKTEVVPRHEGVRFFWYFLIVTLVVICLGLLSFFLYLQFLFWQLFNYRQFVLPSLLALGSLQAIALLVVNPKYSYRLRIVPSIVIFIATIVVSLLIYSAGDLFLRLEQRYLVDSLWLNETSVHLVLKYELDTPAYYQLFECNRYGSSCEMVATHILAKANYPGGDNNLVVTPELPTTLSIAKTFGTISVHEGDEIIFEYSIR